jgi:hypothetical protein
MDVGWDHLSLREDESGVGLRLQCVSVQLIVFSFDRF